MFRQKPFPFSLAVLGILIIVHLVGSYYSLYWIFPWFDIVAHLLGGLFTASLFLWLAIIFEQIKSLRDYKIKSLAIALIFATLMGVVWELFENLGQTTFIDARNYSLDTATDILNTALGGVVAYIYFIKRTCATIVCNNIPPLVSGQISPEKN